MGRSGPHSKEDEEGVLDATAEGSFDDAEVVDAEVVDAEVVEGRVGGIGGADPDVTDNVASGGSRTCTNAFGYTIYGTEARRATFWGLVAVIVAIVLAIAFRSPGAPGEAAARNAVDEIVKLKMWSLAPVPFSEANAVVTGKAPAVTPEFEGSGLTSSPTTLSPVEVTQKGEALRGRSILMVGRVERVETISTQFFGSTPEELKGLAPKSAIQIEFIGNHTENAYAEIRAGELTVSVGDILVVRGEVAANGETKGKPEKRSAYMICDSAQRLYNATEIDSDVMRERYQEAGGR